MDHQHHIHHAMPGVTVPHTGHEHTLHDHHHAEDFKKRFFISLALTLPVLIISPMIQAIFHYTLHFPYQSYLLFLLSSVIFIYGGKPFLTGLVTEIQNKKPGMMTLIAVAITVAYLYSSAIVFGLSGMDFFWELATLIDIMLLGHWIEMRSVQGASGALQALVQLLPAQAHLLHGDHAMDIKIEELAANQIILIKPGEKIPADGIVIEGESYVDESMLTGESTPVLKKKDENIISGSLNGNGSLKVQVSKTGKDSYLSRVIDLVREAQKTKSQTQKLADKAALWLTIFALTGGVVTLAVWILSGAEISFALERMVTVMVISCPHALGLAIPLVASISTSLGAQKGLLIRNRTAFENARKITTVIFDKTGTLTEGKFGVTRIQSFDTSMDESNILHYAAALEQSSEHPIASGILSEAQRKNIAVSKTEKFEAIPGRGVHAIIEGKEVSLVSRSYLTDKNISLPENFLDEGATTVFLLIDNKVKGFISLADKIRSESKKAIHVLKEHNIKTIMLTGDNARIAESVSNELQLDGFYAELLPHQKLEKIKELQSKGEFVAMTGDGVNDAPALAQADVGIAIGSGTDVAGATADIILVQNNPHDVVSLILFGRATYKKMIQNLIWATAYNAVTLPLATGFIAGITITPALGALFMSLSTVVVAVNAQFLRKQV